MNNKLRIGLNNASLTSPNLGVQALTYSAILFITESLGKHKEIVFYVFDSYKKYEHETIEINGQSYKVKSIKFNFSKKLWFEKSFKEGIVENWKECDIIWDLGGGDSWSDIYGKKRFFVSLISMFIIFKLGKKLVLPPQTIGPFKNSFVKKLANYAMAKCSSVYPRDQKSADYLNSNLPNLDYTVIPDMALFLPYENKKNSSNEIINVGLNISGLLFHGGYTQNNQFDLIIDYEKLMFQIIDFFKSKSNVRIHLVSHVIEEKYGVVEDDVWAANEINKNYSDLIIPEKFKNPMEAKSYISGLDFFLGARMHSTIAAFSTGVPVVPLAYSRKFSGLFAETLGYKHVVDLRTMNNDQCMRLIEENFNNRLSLKAEIESVKRNKLEVARKKFSKAISKDFKKASLI